MPQKPLRTMQDDIKEAQEKLKRPVFGFAKKNKDEQKTSTSESEIKKPEENKDSGLLENTSLASLREKASLGTTDTNKEEKPNNFNGVVDKISENLKKETPKPRNFENIIKKDISNINKIRKQNGEAEILEMATENKSAENKLNESKRKELEDLTKRISSSLNESKKEEKTQIQNKPEPAKKDDELKNLINRISADFKRNNKIEQNTAKEDNAKKDSKEEIPSKKEEGKTKNIPYWSKLQKDLKKEKVDSKKLSTKEETQNNFAKTPDIIKEEEEKAKEGGLIMQKTVEENKETDEKEETKKEVAIPKFDSGYISPENRLVFGKQEYYSSIHKKVKPKTKKDNLDQFKEIMENSKDYKSISEEEEKKMLKKQIFKKYKIKLSFLPWKKIIIGSFVFFTLLGGTLFYVLPLLKQNPEEIPVNIAEGKNIDFVEERIPLEITTTESQFKIINYFDGNSAPWDTFYDGQIIKIKISKDEDKKTLIPIDEALISILGENNFNSIPEDFKESITEEYNILVFKDRDNMRLGLVFKFDETKNINNSQEMFDWESTDNSKEEINNIMEGLFLDSKTSEGDTKEFKSGNYQDIEIRYLNLPDSETSIDYFIYNNLVFFTTSQETTSNLIDIIK